MAPLMAEAPEGQTSTPSKKDKTPRKRKQEGPEEAETVSAKFDVNQYIQTTDNLNFDKLKLDRTKEHGQVCSGP